MSDTTINGYPVYRADHKQPYYGAWTAEVEHDANERVTGSATLTLLDRTWVGTVVADPNDSTLAFLVILVAFSVSYRWRCRWIAKASRANRMGAGCASSNGTDGHSKRWRRNSIGDH